MKEITLFVAMKVTAFLMAICMALISVFAGNVQAMPQSARMECCQQANKTVPCDHESKQDTKRGICLTRLCCNVIGFTTAKPVMIPGILPVFRGLSLTPFSVGTPSGYAALAFQPPEV